MDILRLLSFPNGRLGLAAARHIFIALMLMSSETWAAEFGAPVTLAGHTYRFPRDAHDIAADLGGKRECITLRLKFPEMTGWVSKAGDQEDLPNQLNRYVQYLICDPAYEGLPTRWTPLQRVQRVAISHIGLSSDLRLDPASGTILEGIMEQYESKPHGAATELVSRPETKPTTIRQKQLAKEARAFIAREDGHVSTFLWCLSFVDVPNPNCKLHFSADDLYVSATFPLRRMNEWQAIREVSRQYLLSYRLR